MPAAGSEWPKFHLFSLQELERLPPAEWLIDGVCGTQSQVVLYGPPSNGKTFLALDMALSVATGLDWCGRSLKQGPVIYVTGESYRGVYSRVKAWCEDRGVFPLEAFRVVREPVQLLNMADVDLLMAKIQQANIAPRLIVLDTLARCTEGAEENSSKDIGIAVGAMRRLQEKVEATVMAVHHTGKNKESERGSSALRAAADAMIRVTKEGDLITIENDKQKEAAEFPKIRMRLKTVNVLSSGMSQESLVPVPITDEQFAEPLIAAISLNANERRALGMLGSLPDQVAATGDWRKATGTSEHVLSLKTFDNWRKSLVAKGYVEKQPDDRYRLTLKGANAIGVPLASQPPLPSNAPATPPPL